MQTDVFIALINPCVALIFSATFLLLWLHRRRRYIAVLGASYASLAAGFMLQYFAPFGMEASRLLSNAFFLVGGVGLCVGALDRQGRKVPGTGVCLLAATGFAAFCWFLFVQPDLNWRILSINFTFGAIAILLGLELRRIAERRMIDRLMLGLMFFYGISFFVRPVVVLWLDGPYVGYENFYQSLYWITLTLSAALFLVMFAVTAVAAITLDIVRELRDESHTDPLSGLLNRRGFEERTEVLLKEALRKNLPATLIVSDLDHFKIVNDTYGHACGDHVIVAFATCLKTCARPESIVGRIGGEEFAILIEGGDEATARLFAEGARAAFSVSAIAGLPEERRFTASFGLAEWREGESVATLFSRADRALYEAKKAGRDCVRIAGAGTFRKERRRYGWQAAASSST